MKAPCNPRRDDAFLKVSDRGLSSDDGAALECLWNWLSSLDTPDQPWTLFVTTTMKRYDPVSLKPWSIDIVDRAIGYFVHRCQQSVFNNAYKRGRRSLGVICVRHHGAYGDHPHFHIVFTCPKWLPQTEFSKAILASASRINWIDRLIDIRPYYSDGAISYLTTDGHWELVLVASNSAV